MKKYVVYFVDAHRRDDGEIGIVDCGVDYICETREEAIQKAIESIKHWKNIDISNDPDWIEEIKDGTVWMMSDEELEKNDFSQYVMYYNRKDKEFCMKKVDCIEFNLKRHGKYPWGKET